MPYRGTNAKRQVIHAKSKNTLRDGAKNNYHAEKKELEHELSQNKAAIEKLLNEGYRYGHSEENGSKTVIHFINSRHHEVLVHFDYSENVKILKALYIN